MIHDLFNADDLAEISKFQKLNILNNEMFYDYLKQSNIELNLANYLAYGLNESEKALLKHEQSEYKKKFGYKTTQKELKSELYQGNYKLNFEIAQIDRLHKTFKSRQLEDELVQHLIARYSNDYKLNIYKHYWIDCVAGVDIILQLDDIYIALHVSSYKPHKFYDNKLKKYPSKHKRPPFKVEQWIHHERNYYSDIWALYDDSYNLLLDDLYNDIDSYIIKDNYVLRDLIKSIKAGYAIDTDELINELRVYESLQ